MTIPRPPAGAGPSGRRLWRSVQREFELGEHERALLVAMCRQVNRLDALEELIAAEGLLVTGHGTTKMHPAVVEARQTAIAVARIAACLRLPAGEEDGDASRGSGAPGYAGCTRSGRREAAQAPGAVCRGGGAGGVRRASTRPMLSGGTRRRLSGCGPCGPGRTCCVPLVMIP